MDEMIRHCQQTVIHRVGVSVRMEAIRTEKHQTRYQPLQAYMDGQSIQQYSRPWKQMVMFIGRTQGPCEWTVPKYKLRGRQRTVWRRLMRLAAASSPEPTASSPESNPAEDSPESSGEQAQSQEEQSRLEALPKACLDFCIALLDEQMTQKEYHSAMVCALAVLGVKAEGWLGPDRYPPILSAIIKISRFMVIQDAFETAGPVAPDASESESACSESACSPGSEPNNSTYSPVGEPNRACSRSRGRYGEPRPDCLALVSAAMDRFMVRGSHSPMQWMLDLRTYGLKIHYNTTAEGSIDWVGEQILYRNIQFTMAELRGMVHGLVAETQQILMDELMFGLHAPVIPWNSLRDNPVNAEKGWNFIQDARNPWPVDGSRWLRDQIKANPDIQQRFVQPGERFRWNKPANPYI
ncbi:hypothetical protein ABVK25_012339 [Lepraria finkii]|uniref:Uncharacterized protein n=1 Tax=Lepraria finkii TaxID=1340010 RepID=A0ABR4AFK0_9LECA